ncbi:MAG TPA: substrate-binding domain-containing protein [Solirubrobacteraceae bacterium]|nr:substrate-binding domain-containing protein [Solirubrobacteraceae bacterium]
MRRAVPLGIATAAALALGAPGVASAKKVTPPNPDVLEQCSGAQKIESEGSTFQAPAMFLWTGVNSEKSNEELHVGFNFSSSPLACAGLSGQGSLEKPVVYDNQTGSANRGSGSCLKTWGNGIKSFGEVKSGETYPRVKKFPLCGTDEAPTKAVKEEFEGKEFMAEGGEAGKGEAIESIPVAQGAVAVIVHLPKNCLATSEITTSKGKVLKLGRLALDQEVVEEIYRGTIKTWAQAMTKEGSDGHDTLTCKESAENDTIRPVVRADKSGTTHIFKEFLAQVYTGKWAAEEFKEVNGGEKPCTSGELGAGASVTWAQVGEGCENQRWPEAAHILRPVETGNPGVINEVNNTESSIGYADLAVAQEKGFFSKKNVGGENKKGEQHTEFWAPVQNSEPGTTPVTFADPSSKEDKEKEGDSNCKDTKYVSAKGEEFPPLSTRYDWSKVKGEDVSKTYPICGLTYILAARQYYYFLSKYGVSEAESQKIATTVHDFLVWAVNTGTGGGGKLLKNSDYEALPKTVQAEAEFGAEEVGSKVA